MNNEGISETQNISIEIEREVPANEISSFERSRTRLNEAIENLDKLISNVGSANLAPEEVAALTALHERFKPENVPTF